MKSKRLDHEPGELTSRVLLVNLYLTQLIVILAAVALLWCQGRLRWELFGFREGLWWGLGACIGLGIAGINWLLGRYVPKEWMDDGGINRLLFQDLSIPHIAFVALLVAVGEELLFRGALQHWLGVIGTSFLFSLIHFRYVKRWFLMSLILFVSVLLGWLTEISGSLAPVISAHFMLDFVLGTLIRLDRSL
ncbi:CPBP family intramembrane glutamic endopeptidase [Salinithrix halophila]|uniref:CPBP family intramembrane glutamic endopeptidase n=1 Tax=Salinithrix halophila TaxID=1485204 RepID=A0ABV8JHA0_9BACL